MAKRCVAYCRVSTNQEKQKTSIESQKEYYKHKFEGDGFLPSPYGMLCKRDGTTEQIPALYVDEGISGTCIEHREAFKRMISDALLGRFDIIYVKSVSRFARNTVDGLKTLEELRRIGVGVFFEDCGTNSLEPDSDTVLTVLFMLAQRESQTKSTNVKWGIEQRQKAGLWYGRDPYGYDNIGKAYAINEVQAQAVRMIYQLFTEQDYSVRGIRKYLNERLSEYPTKRGKESWGVQTIHNILSNPIYKGEYHTHVMVKVGYKATDKRILLDEDEHYIHDKPELKIVEPEVWEKAQLLLQKREEKYSTIQYRNTSKHTFSTLVYCRYCGAPYMRKRRKSYQRKDGTSKDLGFYWGCRNAMNYGSEKCTSRGTMFEEDLDTLIKEEILSLQDDIKRGGNKLEGLFRLYLLVRYEEDHKAYNAEEVAEEQRKIERKKAILLEDRSEGLMSKELYQKEVKALNERAEALELKAKENALYDDNIRNEWERFRKYKKMVLGVDAENLTNSTLKQIFHKIYVGVVNPELKRGSQKYLIYSYQVLGYSVEELIALAQEKGYSVNIEGVSVDTEN